MVWFAIRVMNSGGSLTGLTLMVAVATLLSPLASFAL
jgi:hypothetical protein